jgi:penicillin-binding protein-related factor A (putative recombinase)
VNSKYAHKGRGLERTLEFMHMVYRNQDIAYIDRKEVPKIVDKRGNVHYAAKTGFDYEGLMVGTGRFICMEAKEHAERLPIDAKGLKLHQIQALIKYGEAGAWSGVVWDMYDEGVIYIIDWQFLKTFMAEVYGIRKERGKLVKSIKRAHVADVCLAIKSGASIDYLQAL